MRMAKRNLFSFSRLLMVAILLGLCAGHPAHVNALESGDVKIKKALGDLTALKSAVDRFRADNALWPNRVKGTNPATNSVEVLYSEGSAITSPSTWPVDNSLVYKQMSGYFGAVNDRDYPAGKWKGPYLAKETADPWGNTYLIGVKNLENNMPVWIISAGPDGIVQTPIDSPVCMDGKSLDPVTGLVAAGDDICLKYK